ncbi:MAG: PAS domain S-box protein [Pyrinomonadaceae bacterium]
MADETNKVIRHPSVAEDLRDSEMRYRRLFESARDGILILDADSRQITDVNPSMVELLGYSRDEFLGKELWEIGLFKDKDESETALRELPDAGNLRQENLLLKSKAGEFLEVEFVSNLYAEGDRQVIQCNIRDVTGRRRAESERHAAREELAQSAALLAQMAGKAARLGGWTIDLPERTLTWSDENCAIHEVPPGYKPTLEEGIGYFPQEYRAEVTRHVDECAREGTPYDFEFPKLTAKGRLIWVRSIGEAVRDAEGKIIRLQGAFQDITKRKEVEAEREKLIKELQDALAEVKTLQGILPICMTCKRIRDDEGAWTQLELYIKEHTGADFSHGMCDSCGEKMYPEIYEKLRSSNGLKEQTEK